MYHPFIHLMLCSRLRLPLTIEDIIISLLFLSQGTLDWISSSRTGNDVVDVVNFLLKEIKFPPPKKKKDCSTLKVLLQCIFFLSFKKLRHIANLLRIFYSGSIRLELYSVVARDTMLEYQNDPT